MKRFKVIVLCPDELKSSNWEEIFPITYENAEWTCVVVEKQGELWTHLPCSCFVEILGPDTKFGDWQDEWAPLIIQVQLQQADGETTGYYLFNLETRQMQMLQIGAEEELGRQICLMTVEGMRRKEAASKRPAPQPRVPAS